MMEKDTAARYRLESYVSNDHIEVMSYDNFICI